MPCAVSQLLVLCYHAVSPGWSADLSVTPDAFERQISGLVREGWTSSTFTEVIRGTRTRGGKTLVVTFDDAFLSVKTYALPVLRELGVVGTVFAPTDYVTRHAPLAWLGLDHWQRGPDAAELTPMTWDDLGELAEVGWEIGSHTRTHPPLTTLEDDALAAELGGSRQECAERIGRPVTAIAYPYGNLDRRVARGAQRAGYEAAAALTLSADRLDPYRYPRIGIYHKDSGRRFGLKTGRWSRSSFGSRLRALRH
jgi:peptidoglycan/xylan/chitin deacetylase (PgdA/CDA1 family)